MTVHTGNIERNTAESEHIGPDWTGDNINAKKVAVYVWDTVTSTWQRQQQPVTKLTQTDVFNQMIIGTRNNQLEIDFSGNDPDTITTLTVTKTNGGDATNGGGQATFSTGTDANGEIKAITTRTVTYHPHSENYAAFTAIFTQGIGNSFQRIGLYDDNNGFFIGYEGAEFGVTKRSGGVDSFTMQAMFNVDKLVGQAGSKYTRNGTPEALDHTKDNLYRIRYGWLGAAPIYYEVLSPDGEWVTFHIIKHPNTTNTPTIEEPNQPLRVHLKKTNDGVVNLTLKTACWAAGTSSDLAKITSTLYDESLAKTVRAVITGVTTGQGGSYKNVKVNPSGALTVENTPATSSTGTSSTASVTNANTTILASNGNRKAATIYNEGSVACYVKLGATASATTYTTKLAVDGYYEVPGLYTGIITGITASGTATLRVTELT